MTEFNSDIIFIDTSGTVRSTDGDLTLRADDTGTRDIIIGSGQSLRPEVASGINLGSPEHRWGTLYASNNYSIGEVDTGRLWINASGIFQKVLEFANGPNNSVVTINHGIPDLGVIINARGMMTNNSVYRLVQTVQIGTVSSQMLVTVTNTQVRLQSGSGGDFSSFHGFVILEYTKSSNGFAGP